MHSLELYGRDRLRYNDYDQEVVRPRRRRRDDNVSRSALKLISSRIEEKIDEIKRAPSLQGCGKDTIIAIILIISVIVSIQLLTFV